MASSADPILCQQCDSLSLYQFEIVKIIKHVTLGHLEANASSCKLCRLLQTAIERAIKTEYNDPQRQCEYPPEYRVWLTLEPVPRLYISERPRVELPTGEALYFFVASEQLPLPLIDGYLLLNKQPPGSIDDMHRLREWVDEDVQCEPNQGDLNRLSMRPLPATLLEVNLAADSSSGYRVRVVKTDAGSVASEQRNPKPLNWVALSYSKHATGIANTAELDITKPTGNEILIPWPSLSSLAQDAVRVTVMLGSQYLWTHELCPVKDENEVAQIFRGSYCALVSHSDSETAGFLQAAVGGSQAVAIGKRSSDTGSSGGVSYVSLPPDFISDVEFDFRTKRADAFLQRLAARRVIHFTDTGQIYFESYGRLGTRSRDGAQLYTETNPSRPRLLPSPHNTVTTLSSRQTPSPLTWLNFVERYTSCDLGPGQGRLPLLQPLAAEVHKATGVGYLSGVWRDRAHLELLWAAKRPPMRPRSTPQPMPSWSWAALEGPVQYPLSFEHRVTTIWKPRAEITGVLAPQPDFMAGTGVLIIKAQVIDVAISSTANAGRNAQRLPLLKAIEPQDTRHTGLTSLGDVAKLHGLGTVETPEQWEAVGYRSIALISDPELDDHTPVRYVADEATNAIGFAVLDETPGFALEASARDSEGTRFCWYPCMAVAESSVEDPPGSACEGLNRMLPTRTFVMVLKETAESRMSRLGNRTYRRVGIGCLQGDVPFAGRPVATVNLV
ncbi:hypothetical protein B0T19DRAFT_476366 [Cercophora scortea]|uniref:Heterokaryon incompatibility domain-containing protein n=1 Tax=Cercophora scortea TaxID=314031 RepID=A0AAE0M988_9PEZI|nr:hypothetical protein B0T19DRAFT_476366 [Cercophora scortea]